MKSGVLSVLLIFFGGACAKHVTPIGNSQTSASMTATPAPPGEIAPQFSKTELLEQLNRNGTLEGVQTSQIDRAYEVIGTSSDEKYFLSNGRVVSSSRRPKEGERSLMYWRNYFKGKLYRETQLTRQTQGHSRPLLQLACDQLGQGVLYDPAHERVMRIFYYEAQ